VGEAMDLIDYMKQFEIDVLVKGYNEKLITNRDPEPVPMRPGKYRNTHFGKFLGKTFNYDGVIAINYYGHFKVSTGILRRVEDARSIFRVKSVMSPIIYFAAIHAADVKKIDPGFIKDFEKYKRYVSKLRWG
jgi:hypothetical protein